VSADRVEPDDGLHSERTALAWERSSLALVAVAALAARQSGRAWPGAVVLLAVIGVAAAIVVAARRRQRPASRTLGLTRNLALASITVALAAHSALAILLT
jgi:hypothetical protein